MRIFVVGTGRCGTCTFYQAARHAKNYTAAHESNALHIGPIDYPDNHIEIDPHLAYTMGIQREKYPDAKWVHLLRDRDACARSQAQQSHPHMDEVGRHWFQVFQPDALETAYAFIDCINANIRAMLPDDPDKTMTIHIETAAQQWPDFWNWIRADGSMENARRQFQRAYNPGKRRGRDNFIPAT